MNFGLLEQAATAFTLMVNRDLGREAIKPMTLEIPQPPPDHYHFDKLVVWCFGFFFEAAGDVLKECKALLSQGAPERTNRYVRHSKIVQVLRTYKVHNLHGDSNEAKRTMAENWILGKTADGNGIAGATTELCKITVEMLNDLSTSWQEATKDQGDAAQLVQRVLDALDGVWEPHELDDIVRNVAQTIQLSGLDVPAFRTIHIEEWRKAARYFENREAAAEGLRRIIQEAMQQKFGQPN